jgi:vesicle coat complex subunit
VRKTACFCVVKLFNTCPSLVRENGFIESLEELLNDGNAVVVSSALISLMEISILSGEGPYKIRSKILKRILLALNETNEWGVVYILDTLTFYKPKKVDVAEKLIEAIIPKLTHSNPAVIISSVKVILNLLDYLEENSKNVEIIRGYYKKLSNSIITIVKSIPEIQYSLLRYCRKINIFI